MVIVPQNGPIPSQDLELFFKGRPDVRGINLLCHSRKTSHKSKIGGGGNRTRVPGRLGGGFYVRSQLIDASCEAPQISAPEWQGPKSQPVSFLIDLGTDNPHRRAHVRDRTCHP